MLRFVIVVLLLANAGYFAWHQGWLQPLGLMPYTQSEAWRLQQQVQADAVVVQLPTRPTPSPAPEAPPPTPEPAPKPEPAAPVPLDSDSAAVEAVEPVIAPEPAAIPPQPDVPPASTPTPEPAPAVTSAPPPICLQAGPLNEEQAKAVRSALRTHSLPPEAWDLSSQTIAGRWMVYLSQPSAEAAMQRRTALRAQKFDVDRAGGTLEPGLSLGRFSTEEAATRELTRLLGRGLRGARIVQERPSTTLYTLRLPALSAEQRASLRSLEAALGEQPLQPCK